MKSNSDPYNEPLDVDICFALLLLVPLINKINKLWHIMTCDTGKFISLFFSQICRRYEYCCIKKKKVFKYNRNIHRTPKSSLGD